jgi:hypothetical protein
MRKNKLAHFFSYASPYGCERSFLSALVCVRLRLMITGVFSVRSEGSSDPECGRRGAGERIP